MAAIDLGKVVGDKGVSMRDRGDWNATAQYVNNEEFMDTVSHKGNLYICVTTNTASEPTASNEAWRLAAQGGEKLVTLAEVALVTEPGFYVDAMAVKELNSNLRKKITAGAYSNADIVTTTQTITFTDGTASFDLSSIANIHGTIRNAFSSLISASGAVITSTNVSNNAITIKCSNLTGSHFEGSLSVEILLVCAS